MKPLLFFLFLFFSPTNPILSQSNLLETVKKNPNEAIKIVPTKKKYITRTWHLYESLNLRRDVVLQQQIALQYAHKLNRSNTDIPNIAGSREVIIMLSQ